MEQVRAACEAVASFLLFFPEDETMLKNKRFYQSKFQLPDAAFTPETVHFTPSSHLVVFEARH